MKIKQHDICSNNSDANVEYSRVYMGGNYFQTEKVEEDDYSETLPVATSKTSSDN